MSTFVSTWCTLLIVSGQVSLSSSGWTQESGRSEGSPTIPEASVTKEMEASLIRDLAEQLAMIGEREGGPVLLYAEAGAGWVGGSIFVSQENSIVWISEQEDDPLGAVLRFWEAMPSGQKWRGMSLVVNGKQFSAEFDYGEGWNEDEDEGDRREPIVRRHFGGKPIEYPPLEGAQPWGPS
jgi:hypothetical protein